MLIVCCSCSRYFFEDAPSGSVCTLEKVWAQTFRKYKNANHHRVQKHRTKSLRAFFLPSESGRSGNTHRICTIAHNFWYFSFKDFCCQMQARSFANLPLAGRLWNFRICILIGSVKPPQTVLLPRAEDTVGNGRFVMLEIWDGGLKKCWLMINLESAQVPKIFLIYLVVPMFFQMVCGELGEL